MDKSASVIDGSHACQCSRGAHGHSREQHDSPLKNTLLHTSMTTTKDDKVSAHAVAMEVSESECAVAMCTHMEAAGNVMSAREVCWRSGRLTATAA